MGRIVRRAALGLGAVLAIGAGGLLALRIADGRADAKLRAGLVAAAGAVSAPPFDPVMLDGLPEPAQRYFLFAMEPGTPLYTAAAIEMGGELSLGTGDDPRYQDMRADQVIAPPHGFVWQVRMGGAMRVTGSDALGPDGSWSRFRLLDGVPVGRVSRDRDHRRSSFGRMVGEGLFWTPAAFLPAARAGWDAIEWRDVDADTAEVRVRAGDLEQSARVTVAGNGRPLRVVFERWSDENVEGVYRLQPFGGDLSEFATFDGFRLPTRVIGGNHYGTDLYHPFFQAKVETVSFF
jgi:hypothetical protein